jgi:hypothetical protein
MNPAVAPIPLEQFTAQAFQAWAGREIQFLRPPAEPGERGKPVTLELIQVRGPGNAPPVPTGHRAPFSLLFRLNGEAPLQDRFLHTLHHAPFESCELLISRVFVPELDSGDGTMFYEAVFG